MPKTYKYYDLILGGYVCILLCANLIGPAKVSTLHLPLVGSVTFVAGVLFFPISYLFGDILTEVYGYARDRRVVWAGFGALLFASLMSLVDSGLFCMIAFLGLWPLSQLVAVTITQYLLKSAWEILATPLTYVVVRRLKRAEQEDYYDRDTDFTPFSLKT
jgi:uncharacterized PurR-regulated membrane protein YhhQ (DUF165 family)